MFEAMAWQVRLQYHLARGNALEIASCRRKRDLVQARNPVTSQHASTGLQLELGMAGRYNDLMQLKNLLGPLDAAEGIDAGRALAVTVELGAPGEGRMSCEKLGVVGQRLVERVRVVEVGICGGGGGANAGFQERG